MGRKLVNMGYQVVVAGNERNKVETLKFLASAVAKSDELVGQVVGNGMLENADGLANSPAYSKAVEVLALYLVEMVEKLKGINESYRHSLEDEDEVEEEENDFEDLEVEDNNIYEDDICSRCGVVNERGEDIGYQYVCYDCMTANEYFKN